MAQSSAQPFIDVANLNAQFFSATYKDSLHTKNQTNDYFLNLFFPKEFENGNVFLARLNSEVLHSECRGPVFYSADLFSFSLPIGFQFLSGNKKWKWLLMAIPKFNGDGKTSFSDGLQVGGTSLFTYIKSEKLKFKFGLYYNTECFGDFFVPLAGMDWKATAHLSFYGTLPNNYRVEYKWGEKLFTGIGFRSFQRSYRLSSYQDYVRVKENLVKVFVDYFAYKKIVVFAEASYSIGYSLLEHTTLDYFAPVTPLYLPANNGFLFSGGIVCRIRKE
jgi:hypothetical protein